MNTPSATSERLRRALWPAGSWGTWAVLDGAAWPGLPGQLAAYGYDAGACALFPGETPAELVDVVPYLVPLAPDSALADALSLTWGEHRGVALVTAEEITEPVLRRHLQTLATVTLPGGGGSAWFRWYDPRVLGAHVARLDPASRAAFFGPVQGFVLEDEAGAVAVIQR